MAVMKLSRHEVDNIALLARLELSDEERERAGEELSQILDHFEQLKQLDTEGVPATSHAVPVVNVLRADEVRTGLARDAALANAPESAGGMFQVPRVVEAD